MGVYAGLDISLDAVAICVVGETGEVRWQGKVLGDPEAVKAVLNRWRDDLVRVGLEGRLAFGRTNGQDAEVAVLIG